MAEGIRDKVAIAGMGCTKFGELWDKSAEDLIIEAYKEAMVDAGIEKKDLQAVFVGNFFEEINLGKTGGVVATTLKLPFLPVTRLENACASGSEALRAASYAVGSGAYDIALAIGVEKLKDTGYGGLPQSSVVSNMVGTKGRFITPNRSAPGAFAMLATRYFSVYGLSPEEGKRAMARVSAKSHHNGTLSPKAHLHREVSVEDIVKAPIVAWPLGLFDCCGVSDGAAAAIVTTPEMAKTLRPDPVYVKALQVGISSGEELMYTDWDGAHCETTLRVSTKAYKEAGISNPREELSMMETHDCFSITELTEYEDLQISPRGRAREDAESGFFDLDGQIPCQPDGGLKCFGHPIGASGLRMMYEMYKQLQGKADQRQIKDPKFGLTHNMGGVPAVNVVSVFVVGL